MTFLPNKEDEPQDRIEPRMKRMRIDLSGAFGEFQLENLEWRKTVAEGLDLDYVSFLPGRLSDQLMEQLEDTVQYYDGQLTKVKVFGKWHQIPRQQVAYGDEGMSYKFSGNTIPAKPWLPTLKITKDLITRVTGVDYNFVLVNRYRNGADHIGEHRDAEPELDPDAPIASLSLGQSREFILKHGDARKKGPNRRNIAPVKLNLQHGSLLLMNPPTNQIWYHSLPSRKNANGIRINLTFRKLLK